MENYLGYYKPKVLIGIIAAFAVLAFLARENWTLSFSLVSLVSASSMIFSINKWLWKYRPFIWLFRVPNFSGRYEGYLEYEFRNENCEVIKGRLKHVKIIHQTGSKIKVDSFTIKNDGEQSSVSENIGMYIEDTGDGKHFRLIYSYLNTGSPEQGFFPHYGTEVIKFIPNSTQPILSGRYYTERLPFQTKGKFIELKKISDNLEHIF